MGCGVRCRLNGIENNELKHVSWPVSHNKQIRAHCLSCSKLKDEIICLVQTEGTHEAMRFYRPRTKPCVL